MEVVDGYKYFEIENKNTGKVKIYGYGVQNRSFKIGKFYEEQMLDAIAELKPRNIMDVGANIGNHSIYFSKICNKVLCFEPVEKIFNVLIHNMGVNNIDNYTAVGLALSDKISMYSNKNINLYEDKEGDIISTTIDEYVLPEETRYDLIKIDCEGMDDKVLMGGINYISKVKPHIFIEAKNGDMLNRYKKILLPIGYKLGKRYNATPTWHFYV